ncbi:MAG: 7-cyano-7-deazaguanine synthase [Bacteroidota bacterium]
MSTEIKTCSSCILDETINGVIIGDDGICNYCKEHEPFIPHGEEKLLQIFKKAQNKKRHYDALVPLSGGKDSTYVLYLAVKKYKLNVLTYTYNNGFMSDFAKKNIEASVNKLGVDHVWVKHDPKLIKELYRTALLQSGEICGICGVGIERSMLKVSEAWKIPLILLGHTPTEANSFTSENIYDQHRIKAIFAQSKNINKQMLKRFLVYMNLDFINTYLYTKTGRFGKKVHILYYIDIPSEKEIGDILKAELGWREPDASEYSRHFDCIAEPFTNFIRDKRFGSSRRIPQLSNLIRYGEISRDEAIRISEEDAKKTLPENYEEVKAILGLRDDDIEKIGDIPVNVFGDKKSTSNMIFTKVRSLLKKGEH